MIFSLEALEAQHGDCLILHYSSNHRPRFIVIDGGPDTVYRDRLRPRLEQIREKWGTGEDRFLNLDMLMVSHIDDDHINAKKAEPYKVGTL